MSSTDAARLIEARAVALLDQHPHFRGRSQFVGVELVDGTLVPFKTLFRTDAFGRPGQHLPRDRKAEAPVLCNGSGLKDGEFFRKARRSQDPLQRKFAQINHYGVRDLPSFLLNRTDHGSSSPDLEKDITFWQQHDRNDVPDQSLSTRAPAIREEMEALSDMSDGRLMRLRRRALRQWQTVLDDMDEDMIGLRQGILGAETPHPRESMVTPFRLPGPQPVFSSVRAPEPDDVKTAV